MRLTDDQFKALMTAGLSADIQRTIVQAYAQQQMQQLPTGQFQPQQMVNGRFVPFPNNRGVFVFSPQPDITALELAKCLMCEKEIEKRDWDLLPSTIQRHFRKL